MTKRTPPTWLCITLLAAVILWRMAGAPLRAEELENVGTSLWQARVLLPSRLQRVLIQWFPAEKEEQVSFDDPQQTALLENEKEPIWINVYLHEENRIAQMTLEGYVCGVVAAEMPAAYHMEALKAQTVAARTRALSQLADGGCRAHEGADICTDSTHCQAYATPGSCMQRWGESYEAYRDRIVQAQRETYGEWMSYEGAPITVLYHAISGGRTEDAQTVFSQALPYLVSVESNGEESALGFRQDMTFSYEELARTLHADAQEIRRTLSVASYTETGRVDTLRMGDKSIKATELRSLLGLRSTWFSLSMNDDGVTFHQQGYGHGVGMSQAGANSMAGSGSLYDEILLHYYPGVTIENTLDV